jgi:hypothetical protein
VLATVEKAKGWKDRYDGGEVFYVADGAASLVVSDFLDGLETGRFAVNTGDIVEVIDTCAAR